MVFIKRKLPGNLYGFGIGKALGGKGKVYWGLFVNCGKWNLRFELR